MKKVAFVGFRGMVGSVLMERMAVNKDFENFESFFFSSSLAGADAPSFAGVSSSCSKVLSSNSISELKKMDIIVTCQGGGYSLEILPLLNKEGWSGHWIDASSAFRMDEDAVIVLDPLNDSFIKEQVASGAKKFIGGNCTVSLLLMALAPLLKVDAIEWVSSMTYQAASGGGARHMCELLTQMGVLNHEVKNLISAPNENILSIDKKIAHALQTGTLDTTCFGAPLAASLIPWIDSKMDNGQTKEEWKAMNEASKILGRHLPVDGTCVRVGAMRCHSQALTIKLKKDMPLNEIESMLKDSHEWLKFIENDKEETLKNLTPAAVSGNIDIPIGRVRKMAMGNDYLNAFTCGDQLLWGAAEPLRRMLSYLL